MKKKGLLITVIILLVLALIGGIFAYIFFATDTFLSEKERFAKYALKIGNEKSGFVTSTLNNYFEKKNNTAYTNNGSINANVQILTNISDDELSKKVQSLLEAGNNTTIQFNGKIDNPNKKIEEEITLKYTDTESFPIKFKRDGDIYGLQSDNVMTSYIAFENNNLKELARKFGVYDVSQIPDKIELKEMSLTEEEIRYIQNNYILPVYNGIGEEKFSQIENEDGSTTYKLELTYEDLKSMYLQVLDILKNDQVAIDKINSMMQEAQTTNEYYTTTLTKEDIEKAITAISEEEVEEGSIQISLTKTNGVINKVSITSDELVIDLLKEENSNTLSYIVSVKVSSVEVMKLEANYSGLNTNSVTEDIAINIDAEELKMQYSINNNVTFGGDTNINSFGANEAVIINNYSAEQIVQLFEQLGDRIVEVNNEQMVRIGFDTEMVNPITTWFPIGIYQGIKMTELMQEMQSQAEIQQQEMQNQLEMQQQQIQDIVGNMEANIN